MAGPATNTEGTPPRERGGAGDLARAFFGVIARRQTWLNVCYMLLAFPLGLMYFVILVTGLGLGLGLAILWVGIPILLVVAGAWWSFAALERLLVRGLLGLDCGLSPRPWEAEPGVLGKLRAHFTAPSTWRDLAFVLLKFPLGLLSFLVVAGSAALADVLLFAPVITISGGPDGAFDLWGRRIDGWLEALPLMPVGVLVLLVGLHLVNFLAAVWRLLGDALLSETRSRSPIGDSHPASPPGAAQSTPGSSDKEVPS